jgi:tetratricopeptide (TPR) repeat protein
VNEILALWSVYEGEWDPTFQAVLELLVGKNLLASESPFSNWENLWSTHERTFSNEYLYIVEGNLCYQAGLYLEAAGFYEKALELDPSLRPALLNLLFVYARLNRIKSHLEIARRVTEDKRFMPLGLATVGNSFLLCSDETTAEYYYGRLRSLPGWSRKADLYKAAFCWEQGLYAKAARFAAAAVELNPRDFTSVHYLSRSLRALGEDAKALQTLASLEGLEQPDWFLFFRFQLERDLGRSDLALKTLESIPLDFFREEPEREEALLFARQQQNLPLLRTLKQLKIG